MVDVLAQVIEFVAVGVENEFVVDGQDHFRFQLLPAHERVNLNHGNFEHVGRAALNGGVHGVALGKQPVGDVARVDVAQVATPAQNRFGVSEAPRFFDALVDVGFHGRKPRKILFDNGARFLAWNLQPLAQPERRNTVDDTKIDGFGLPAHIATHLIQANVKHLAGRLGVNIDVVVEGVEHGLVTTERGHDA